VATNVVRMIEEVDAVVLVDNSTQPMQAAPVAVIRELVSSGNASKLVFAFTHFDRVKGDNFPTPSAMVDHVLASAENVTASLGEDLGPAAERSLRKRLESARVFLAEIDKPLAKETKWGARTISQFEKLLDLIDRTVERIEPAESKPRYDRMDLVLAVKSAAEAFHNAWFARLGLEPRAGWSKEHWGRVKALSRRLATGMSDHYDTLHPVADLRKDLLDRIHVFVQNPLSWTEGDPRKLRNSRASIPSRTLSRSACCNYPPGASGTTARQYGGRPTTRGARDPHSDAPASSEIGSSIRRLRSQTSRRHRNAICS
jgi:hypothetical protein